MPPTDTNIYPGQHNNTLQFTDGMIADFTSLSKISTPVEHSILRKVHECPRLAMFCGKNGRLLYYHSAPRYFIRATKRMPYFWNQKEGEKLSVSIKICSFKDEDSATIGCAMLNSSLFYMWFLVMSDCRHLNAREVDNFPCISHIEPDRNALLRLFDELMSDYENHKTRKETYYKATGKVVYDEYYPKYSKSIIDKIDELLAKHYGFTEEELDFIINYDIKYRMGDELKDFQIKSSQ